jgi:hypothetical protein
MILLLGGGALKAQGSHQPVAPGKPAVLPANTRGSVTTPPMDEKALAAKKAEADHLEKEADQKALQNAEHSEAPVGDNGSTWQQVDINTSPKVRGKSANK